MFTMGAKLNCENYNIKENKKNDKESCIISKKEHQLVFTFEKRKGKPITLIGRFYLNDKDKKNILKLLKKKLACGGTIKEEWIELQGDLKDKIKEILIIEGWKFK
jgi:translation initiation factor 1